MVKSTYLLGAVLLFGAFPALAQQAPSPGQAMSPGADDDFILGLRRIGVLAGRSVECTSEGSRAPEIDKVAVASNMIASEFGLRAAFNFVGAAGYGSGNPFDKATCADTIKEWTAVQQRYGEK